MLCSDLSVVAQTGWSSYTCGRSRCRSSILSIPPKRIVGLCFRGGCGTSPDSQAISHYNRKFKLHCHCMRNVPVKCRQLSLLECFPKSLFPLYESPVFVLKKRTECINHQIFSLLKLITFGFYSSLIFLALSISLLKEAQHKGFYLCYWLARKWCVCDYWSFSSAYLFTLEGKKNQHYLEKK